MAGQYPRGRRTTRAGGHRTSMTPHPAPADGTLVEREGVNAASDRSTAEGEARVPPAEAALSGGSTTRRPGDRPEAAPPDTTPSPPRSGDTGGVTDPEATYGSESGQDVGSLDCPSSSRWTGGSWAGGGRAHVPRGRRLAAPRPPREPDGRHRDPVARRSGG